MDDRNLTIGDIADALGVSKTTVSRAISGKGRIGEATKQRVLEYINEHNYRPNMMAKGLAQSKTFNIALALPGDYNLEDMSFFQKCLMGISEIANSFAYDVMVAVIPPNDTSQLERMVTNRKIDGVILMRTVFQDHTAAYLKDTDLPFVAIGSSDDRKIIQVDNDHRAACRELTSILLMRGIRRMALIGGSQSHVVTQTRLNGYLDAHRELGIPVDDSMIYLDVESSVLADKIVEELLAKKCECIIGMDDSVCNYVLNKLKKEKVKVPQDIKVASFYNSSMLENNVPSITSLEFDVLELGMMTCRTLLDLIDGKAVRERTLLGYEVSLKESTKEIL
ncbi:MAG: LacI family transcriptional regulator [Clostridiales bacterium]|nr:LacI family transcriptional regulator [Clostridiales bacterium]